LGNWSSMNYEKNYETQEISKCLKGLFNLYEETLHRQPELKGLEHYLTLLLKDETTIEDIRNEMLESQEHFENIFLDKDNISKPLLKEFTRIISNMYKEILNRKPDKRGLNHYSIILASGNMTEEEIRDEFLTSSERLALEKTLSQKRLAFNLKN